MQTRLIARLTAPTIRSRLQPSSTTVLFSSQNSRRKFYATVKMSQRYAAAHKEPKGPGDARPSALQVVEDEGLIGGLQGKTALVTGTSSGIGIETARALAATGARVFAAARDLPKAKTALGDLVTSASAVKGQTVPVELVEMDNDSLDSIRAGALDFLKRSNGQLNILVCNAGIMACDKAQTKDGFERQFGVCHIAHFLLFELVKDALLKSSTKDFNSRLVMLSSMGHRSGGIRFDDYNFEKADPYPTWQAYGQAKTGNIYLANEVDRRYGPQGLHALSLHPGGIHTGLQVNVPREEVARWSKDQAILNYMKDLGQGASTTLVAAVAKEWEGKGGKYLEDCAVSEPHQGGTLGYAPHAYDPAAETKLYEESLKMVAKWL